MGDEQVPQDVRRLEAFEQVERLRLEGDDNGGRGLGLADPPSCAPREAGRNLFMPQAALRSPMSQQDGTDEWALLVADARSLLARNGATEAGLQAIGTRMKRAADAIDVRTVTGLKALHGSGSTSVVLHSESAEGLTLVFSRFPPDAATPVHNHGSWGVALVLEGRDHHVHWRRLDDGAVTGRARLEVDSDTVVPAGEFVTWPGPPGDIHSQQGVGRPVYELVLFGRNVMVHPRLYFDPRAGTVRERLPQ